MNVMVSDVQKRGDPADEGIIFDSTRTEYEAFGNGLLEKLYQLEPLIAAAWQRLIELAQQ